MIDSAQLHPAGFQRAEHLRQLDTLPARFKPAIKSRWAALYQRHGRLYEPNVMLGEAVETLQSGRVKVAGNEEDLRAFAKARADECFRIASRWKNPDDALREMEAIAQRNGIKPPDGRNVTKQGRRARLLCAQWWRRALRRYVARRVEGAAVTLGLVHRKAGIYASHETVARRQQQKRRNRALLESIIAANGEGQEYTLAELSDLGVSNPEIRRGELMTRLAGFDQLAAIAGHAAEFYTLTAPSQFHARESATGRENPKYNGATPRETQKYLCNVWAKVRAALHRRGVRLYGFRVAEPHHDATPHWHMVIFMNPQHVETVRALFRKYALQLDGNETGAAVHRFKAERIDRSKGSAAGYLAKYIAKNIDGHGVGMETDESGGSLDAKKGAMRVDAWAACWGIRQFQQIGGAPVSLWRELRRMKAEDAADWVILEALVKAADLGGDLNRPMVEGGISGWALFCNLMGGPTAKRADMPAKVWRMGGIDTETGEITFNAYGEIAAGSVLGVSCVGAGQVKTRVREWVFKRGGEAVEPWSSVNNCTGDFKNEGNSGATRGRFCPDATGKHVRKGGGGGGICAPYAGGNVGNV